MKELAYLAILGDVLFILWIVYNAIDAGFQNPGGVQAVALSSLIILLILNIVLLWRRK